VLLLPRASRDELGAARVMVGTPLAVVRVGAEPDLELGKLDVRGVPLLDRELEPVRGAVEELRDVPEPVDRVMPPELPPDDRLGLDDRGVLPDEPPDDRLVPPEERLVPPDERLAEPEDRLTPPDERPALPDEDPEDRLLEPDDRLTPPDDDREPEDGRDPPDERLEPPDERAPLLPPEDLPPPVPPRDTRWASTRFTGAAKIATANTAIRKKKTRLGAGISDLRPSSDAGNEKSPAGKLLCL
jgi:hypothetical protein